MIKKWFLSILFTIFFLLSISNFHLSINSSTQPLINSSTVYAFDSGFPKLVWEKEYPFKIDEIVMANESGDVLLSNKGSAQLILIDPQGYERLHLGPKLNMALESPTISANGSKIMYTDAPVRYSDVGVKWRLHFIDRKGKEIWAKDVYGWGIISPNGDWYVLYNIDKILAYDISEKLLWEKIPLNIKSWPDCEIIKLFSLDNNYILTGIKIDYGWGTTEEDKIIRTYTRQGELKWNGNFKLDVFGYAGIADIQKEYIVLNYKDYRKIYDYLGNIVIEIPQGVKRAFISPDGKVVLFQYDNKFEILNLPDKSKKMEGDLNFIKAIFSLDGKYLVGIRKPTIFMPENIVIYNTQDKSMWKIKIGGTILYDFSYLIDHSASFLNENTFIQISNNGKYLLIGKEVENRNETRKLYYYQLW